MGSISGSASGAESVGGAACWAAGYTAEGGRPLAERSDLLIPNTGEAREDAGDGPWCGGGGGAGVVSAYVV